MLNMVVTSEGKPRDIELTESTASKLSKIALEAARSWRFEPGTCEGKAVSTLVLARVLFAANRQRTVQLGSTLISSADPQKIEKYAAEASQALDRRDYVSSVIAAQEVLALAPLAKRIRLTLGIALLELDRYDEAETAFQEEIKLDPTSPFAYDRLGRTYWRQHKYDDAIAQFQKQISTTPRGFDGYADLGILLCHRKRCHEALPALEKAQEISPNQSGVMLAHGECQVDLGRTEEAIREMADAASQSGSADSWNQAAYRLAEKNVELDRAQAWSDSAITIASAQLKSVSLEHVKPTQFRWAYAMASYWDTRAWIYFRRGDLETARPLIDAAWYLRPSPTLGNHLGQIYEKLDRPEDAKRTFAMAIAAASIPTKAATQPEDQAEAMDHLIRLAGPGADVSGLIDKAKAELDSQNTVTVPNSMNLAGEADFLMKINANAGISEVRAISGGQAFTGFAEVVKKIQLSLPIPKDAVIEIPRRATLVCESAANPCRLKMLRAEEARDLAIREARDPAHENRTFPEP